METNDDMDREGGSLIDAAKVRVKEEELDFGDSYSGGAARVGCSTPQSLFSLEVYGLEIVSEPQSRSGSCEPDHSQARATLSLFIIAIHWLTVPLEFTIFRYYPSHILLFNRCFKSMSILRLLFSTSSHSPQISVLRIG